MINLQKTKIFPDGYHSYHGWYWKPNSIAAFIKKALLAKYSEEDLETAQIFVSEVTKLPAENLKRGCHDTLYSATALVCFWGELPTAEEIYRAYCTTSAQFSVEAITGGYHFYTIW